MIGVGFFNTIFRDPVWGIYLFAVFTHIRLEQLGEEIALPLRIPIIIASLTIVIYFLSPKYPRKLRRWPAEAWLFGLMVLGMFVSATTADLETKMSWELSFLQFKYWVFFILFINMVDTVDKVERFHWVLILSAAWLVYRCWDLRGATGLRFENFGGGNVADANHFAAALVLLFPFVLKKTFSLDQRVMIGATILCFGIVMAIFISGSRGGFLGLIVSSVILFLIFRKQRVKIITFGVVLLLAAIFFISSEQWERVLETFDYVSGEAQMDYSARSRLEYWKAAFELFKEHPLTGVGPRNFLYYSGYMVEGLPYGTPGHVTHSLWFEVLVGGGLFVFVPFILMLFRFFWISARLARHYLEIGNQGMALYMQVPMVGLGAFLVSASFIDRMVYEPIYWCIALGVVHRYLRETELVNERDPSTTVS